nr:hypothetical protein [Anaerolineae bacterium]NIN97969.1 hypothetical protein [Anaerolineae bacterium]NIQ80932.1 hypothetical protein [Anaerolineae bacterium]
MKRTLIGLMLQYLPPLRPIKGPSLDVTAALIERSLDIRNPRFLAPFHEQAGVKELKVAHEWGVRWQHGPDADEGYLVRPECYPKNMGPIWDPTADQCQGIQSTYATHNAAFVQVIDAPIGARDIRVEAQVAYYAP